MFITMDFCEKLTDSCRICLKKNNKLMNLYSEDEYEEATYSEMLTKITGIQLEQEDEHLEVPKQICRNCICELNLAYQFRRKALEAQGLIEIYMKAESDTKYNVAAESDQQHTTQSEDQIVQSEGEYTEEEVCKPAADDFTEHYSIEREIVEHKPSNRNLKNEKTPPSEITSDLKDKRNYSRRGRKPKPIEDAVFICDICGNMFSQRSRLTEHRRRHVGHETESMYSCELCGESFQVREKLRRHMYVHVGQKPFKCNYCSRTFFYESVKRNHEAVHAGHKPYVCSKCGKAFAYPHSLKKHELIHADIKLYYCKYCNKDFRLQHHLIQHEKTILHTNKVKSFEDNIIILNTNNFLT